MTDQGGQLAVYGSLRDVLRALDRDDDDLAPVAVTGRASTYSEAPGSSTALVSRLERLPATRRIAASEPEEMPTVRWRDRMEYWRPGPALAMVIPAMGMLFAGSLLIAPAPNAEWAWAALNEVILEGAGASGSAEGKQPVSGIQAFAVLGQRALTAGPGHRSEILAAYGLSAQPVVEARPGETVDLPFDLSSTEPLPSGAKLIIRGVPENAALSSAEPQADGNWAVPADRISEVKLTAYALPTRQSHELVAELRSQSGDLLARATTKLTAAPEPSLAPAVVIAPSGGSSQVRPQQRPAATTSDWAAVTVPAPTPRLMAVQGTLPPAESAPSEQRPVRETPEWMQPWNRSALGGAY